MTDGGENPTPGLTSTCFRRFPSEAASRPLRSAPLLPVCIVSQDNVAHQRPFARSLLWVHLTWILPEQRFDGSDVRAVARVRFGDQSRPSHQLRVSDTLSRKTKFAAEKFGKEETSTQNPKSVRLCHSLKGNPDVFHPDGRTSSVILPQYYCWSYKHRRISSRPGDLQMAAVPYVTSESSLKFGLTRSI